MNREDLRRQSVGKAEVAIQTSIANMNNKSISLDQSKIMIQQYREQVDQSIQMTFEEPPEDFVDERESMLKHQEEEEDEEDEVCTPPDHA